MKQTKIDDVLKEIPYRYEIRLGYIAERWTLYCTTCSNRVYIDFTSDTNDPIPLSYLVNGALQHERKSHGEYSSTKRSGQERLPIEELARQG